MTKVDSITVRMYNTGSVGDCFLLLFNKGNDVTFSMLIDCGGYQTSKEAMRRCVADIHGVLKGPAIDLVVVTHEHLDHVCGFNQAKDVFDTIQFENVWMSWVENPSDPLAKKLAAEKAKKISALTNILSERSDEIRRMKGTERSIRLHRALNLRRIRTKDTLGLLAFENGWSKENAIDRELRNSDAMRYVLSKSNSRDKTKIFRNPGDVLSLKGAEGVKFHILGPPKDADLKGILKLIDHSNVYSFSKALSSVGSHILKEQAVPNPAPFSPKYRMTEKEVASFKRTVYNKRIRWRQAEHDWLDSADEIAMALNSYTNNTSLVIAIELESTGNVLLFPGDAQSGNWLSWTSPSLKETLISNGGKSAEDLLAKTVFYKVGHHGSHNGTASSKGLELMTSNPMTFLPLIEDKIPSVWGGKSNFPAKKLYEALIEKSLGKVVRSDQGLISDKRAVELRSKHSKGKEAKVLKEISKNPLYHEWTVY